MAQVGRGARSGIFFIFVWRNIHFYQLAEEYFAKKGGGLKRLIVTLNLMILFLLNISGFVSSFTGKDGSTTHTQKKRLKAVLNIDKLIEVSFLVVGLIRLTLFPQSRDQSEIMLASIIHHVFFALTVHTYTKLNWYVMFLFTSWHDLLLLYHFFLKLNWPLSISTGMIISHSHQ